MTNEDRRVASRQVDEVLDIVTDVAITFPNVAFPSPSFTRPLGYNARKVTRTVADELRDEPSDVNVGIQKHNRQTNTCTDRLHSLLTNTKRHTEG